MPGIARRITLFTKREITQFTRSSRLISRQPGLDIRVARDYTPNAFGRILVVTPKRVGTAPERNLLRRRLKAIFYQEQLYNYPYIFLIFCKKQATKLTFEQLKALVIHAVNTVHQLTNY